MIRAENLGKRFDYFEAVQAVNLEVRPGELLALLGPNGAGKTTTVRMLSSLLRPSTGRAWVAGWNVAEAPAEVRRSVGMLTEQPGVYLRMPGLEYLLFFGELYGLDRSVVRSRALRWFDQFGLSDAATRRVGEYSKGMRQKLAIIRALLHDPPVLMLDEPTSAMDPQSARTVRDAITRLRDNHRAILLCTHNLAEAELMADRIAIIRQGRIIAQGTPGDLKRRLLGEPAMEVRATGLLDDQLREIARTVTVADSGTGWFRYHTAEPEATNPRLLRILAEWGVEVVTLAEVPQSLEQVYLRVVASEGEANR
jgi:ABC-2 type transport system ATP-binding protein